MFKLIDKQKLSVKIGIVVGFTALALLYVLIDSVGKAKLAARNFEEAQESKSLITISSAIGQLVHCSQRERGLGALFLNGTGNEFVDDLANGRKGTDQAAADLKTLLQDHQIMDLRRKQKPIDVKLAAVTEYLDGKLPTYRQKVDARSLKPAESFVFLSEMITVDLAVLDELVLAASDVEFYQRMLTYLALIQEKESSGQGRASLNSVIRSGDFHGQAMSTFIQVLGQEIAFHRMFTSLATADQQKFYNEEVVASEAQTLVGKITQLAKSRAIGEIEKTPGQGKGNEGGTPIKATPFPYTPSAWMQAATARIDLLKKVEDRLAGDVVQHGAQIEEQARSSRLLANVYLGFAAAAAIAVGLVSFLILRGMHKQTGAIMNLIEQVQAEKYDSQAEVFTGDELGTITVGLNQAVVALGNAKEQEAQRAEVERQQAQREKERQQLETDREQRLAHEERRRAALEKQQADDLKTKVNCILKVVNKAAQGDLTQEIEVHGEDAVGQLGEGLAGFFVTLRGSIATMAQNATALATSSDELAVVSTKMNSNAEETAAQAGVVSAASEQVSKNVQTVATGVEQMSASIREIAKNASEAARVTIGAVKVAESTNATISKLGDSSTEIGKVVKVINSIAQQTNLLALNATIEAARAGEAGKGFAVVANEVKDLAKETAQATEDISRKIEAIQADTQGAVLAIAEIGSVINQINDISSTIASAVEEQTATTNEIARNVAEAARGSLEIAENITTVAQAAQSTTEGAGNTQIAGKKLSRMASELQTLVSQFKFDRPERKVPARTKARQLVNV